LQIAAPFKRVVSPLSGAVVNMLFLALALVLSGTEAHEIFRRQSANYAPDAAANVYKGHSTLYPTSDYNTAQQVVNYQPETTTAKYASSQNQEAARNVYPALKDSSAKYSQQDQQNSYGGNKVYQAQKYATYETQPYEQMSSNYGSVQNYPSQQPQTYHQQPQTYQQQPQISYEQPKISYEQPQVHYQSPKIYQLPQSSYQPPQSNYQQPQNSYKPQNSYQQPQASYQQPQTNYQQPQISYQQPQINYQQPKNSYQQPQNNYQQAEAGYTQSQNYQSNPAYFHPAQPQGNAYQKYPSEQSYSASPAYYGPNYAVPVYAPVDGCSFKKCKQDETMVVSHNTPQGPAYLPYQPAPAPVTAKVSNCFKLIWWKYKY